MTRAKIAFGRWPAGPGVTAAMVAAAACGWSSLDPVVLGHAGPVDAALPGEASDLGNVADAASAADNGDADVESDAPEPDAQPSSAPCMAAGEALDSWTFDSNAQGWSLTLDSNVDGSLAWTSAVGNPSPGAIEAQIAPATDAGVITGGWAEHDVSAGNFSGRTASAWVWLDSGSSPHLKLFVQTGSQYAWADGGTVYLASQTWTCVSLTISSPAYQQAMYDPTDVIRVGFEMLGNTPFRLYIDSVHVR